MAKISAFTRLSQATKEDFDEIMRMEAESFSDMPQRLLGLLKTLDEPEENYGLPVSRYVHSLQTATRALQAGESDEMVVGALFHDVGEIISPYNHDEAAAAILRPYLSEKVCWIVEHHAIFQGYYYWHHLGLDQNAREKWRGHPHFDATARFCEMFDENSFDPNFETLPLEAFRPLVGRVIADPWKSGK